MTERSFYRYFPDKREVLYADNELDSIVRQHRPAVNWTPVCALPGEGGHAVLGVAHHQGFGGVRVVGAQGAFLALTRVSHKPAAGVPADGLAESK